MHAVKILGQLDQVLITISIPNASTAIQVRAIRRATDIAEQHAISADLDLPRRVSWRNVKLRGSFPDLLHDKVTIHSDVIGVRADDTSCFTEDLLRFLADKFDADFFENPHGPALASP